MVELPRLTQAQAPLTRQITGHNEHGLPTPLSIPAERPLTVYVDKRELVTLMTLGSEPELLVLGYLRNQRLLADVSEVESISVDWDAGDVPEAASDDGHEGWGAVGVAAVKTRAGIAGLEARTARKVVTTGCGQGSVFGDLLGELNQLRLPEATLGQDQLYGIVNAIRLQESTYKSAGSVHGCALFQGERMLCFVEDVGRHNAIDTIAGWMWMHPDQGAPSGTGMRGDDKVFYTTGRLTSEMVIKSAQMGVPIVVSRSGITQMGHAVAQRLGVCAIGRAVHRHFVCYSAPERLRWQPGLAGPQRLDVQPAAA